MHQSSVSQRILNYLFRVVCYQGCWLCSVYNLYIHRSCFFWLELHVIQDWQVMPPNTHWVFFVYAILCLLRCTTWKLKVIWGGSTYQMTALLSEISVLWVRAVSEIQLASYGSKHASQPLSDTTYILCVLKLLNQKLQSCMDVVHMEWLLYNQRCLFSSLELDVRYKWQVMVP